MRIIRKDYGKRGMAVKKTWQLDIAARLREIEERKVCLLEETAAFYRAMQQEDGLLESWASLAASLGRMGVGLNLRPQAMRRALLESLRQEILAEEQPQEEDTALLAYLQEAVFPEED